MSWPPVVLWYDVLGGENDQQIDKLRQDRTLLEMSQAKNVIPDPFWKLVTSPGFSGVRSTAITGTPAITGMFSLADQATEFILWGSDGKPYRDNANPPGNITGGADFTTGNTVFVRGDISNNVLICVSSSRDVPQQFTASVVRSSLAGTPPRGIDYKYFGRRGLMFSPSDGTTTYGSRISYTASNDSNTDWANPYTLNFLDFGRPGADVNVLGGEIYMDHCMTFTENQVFPMYVTPNAVAPFFFQDPSFSEQGGGPVSIQSVVKANNRLYWISRNFDVKMLFGQLISSIGYPVQPFLRGLNDSRRNTIVGGWEPKYRCVVWCMSNGTDTTNKNAMLYQVDTGQYYFRTISRNAFANRIVSGQIRLIGGGYSGLFYNEFDTSTTGDLDNSASVIDADVMTARLHLGMPGIVKKVPYVAVEFDPISTESITVQYQKDDGQTWISFRESPFTMTGTDVTTAFFTTNFPYERIRLRIRDTNSGERYRVLRIGFPRPTAINVSKR